MAHRIWFNSRKDVSKLESLTRVLYELKARWTHNLLLFVLWQTLKSWQIMITLLANSSSVRCALCLPIPLSKYLSINECSIDTHRDWRSSRKGLNWIPNVHPNTKGQCNISIQTKTNKNFKRAWVISMYVSDKDNFQAYFDNFLTFFSTLNLCP